MSSADFIGELETMDMTELLDKTFIVFQRSVDSRIDSIAASTASGPYTFLEMVETVGLFYKSYVAHLTVGVVTKNVTEPMLVLSDETIDYIEANYLDIIAQHSLGLPDPAEYTCKAKLLSLDGEYDYEERETSKVPGT